MATGSKKTGGKSVSAKKPATKTAAVKSKATKAAPAKKAPVKKASVKASPAKAVKKPAAKPVVAKATVAKKSETVTKKAAPAKASKTAVKTTVKTVAKTAVKKPAAATKPSPAPAVRKQPVAKAKTTKTTASKQAVRTEALKSSPSSFDITQITPYKEKKGEEYMNDIQRQHIEKILLSWRDSLMANSEGTMSHLKDEAANFPDPSDRASQEEEFSIELRTRDRERKLLKKIEQTLDLLRTDDFGYCEACGIEIGIRRLEARPTATLCIDCKTLAEIKERQTVGG